MMEGIALAVVKVCVVIIVGWGCTRALKSAPASARHAVWATALVIALLLPLVTGSGLTVAVPVPMLSAAEKFVTASRIVSSATAPAPAGRASTAIPNDDRARAVPWKAIVLVVYLTGAAIALLPFVIGAVRVARVRRLARPVGEHPKWAAALGRIAAPAPATVVVSVDTGVPITYGLVRPVVVLPAGVDSWTSEQLRDALVHEFAHVRRFDWGFQLVSLLACAVHWFNPLVWIAARRLRLEAERACDEQVLRLGASPHDYAAQLVALTRDNCKEFGASIAMARRSCLGRRVNTILSYRRSTMKFRLVVTAGAVLLTAGTLLLAPLQPVSASGHQSSWRATDLPPLMEAVADGDLDRVESLIEAGEDVNERVARHGTPLILAAHYGEFDIAAALIAAGADVNRIERDSPRDLMRSALTEAARQGHLDVVELLLDNGARIDATPSGDATALMEAADHRHERIVRLLIDRGADVTMDVRGDGNAVIAAARGGDIDIVKMVVRAGADVNAGVPGDGNALIMAVRARDRKMVEYLLAQGADPTAYVPGDESALIAAAEANDKEMLRLLMDAE